MRRSVKKLAWELPPEILSLQWRVPSRKVFERSGRAGLQLVVLSLLFLSLFISTAFVRAQEAGALHGKVFDERGALVAGAAITIEDARKSLYRAQSDAQGRYSIANVQPGAYTLTVTARGFAAFTQTIDLTAGRAMTLNVALKIVVNEELEVRDKETNLAAITINGRKLAALPEDSRQLVLRLRRLAGATGTPEDLTVYVDGFREDGKLPPKETIASIRVNADPFAAEFAEPGRARIEIRTKPATDDFHAEFNYNFNNESLNARNPFALERPPAQLRNYSGAFGGPLKRKRWGYFFDLNHRAQDENAIINATTLDPATLSPRAINSTVITPSRATDVSFRTSYVFGKNQTLDFRYRRAREAEQNQGLESGFDLPERAINQTTREDTLRLSLTSIFNADALNEARLQLTRRRAGGFAVNSARTVSVLDAFTAGGNQESLFSDALNHNLQFTDTLTRTIGNHTFKVGTLIDAVQLKDINRSNFGGTFVFGTDVERNARGLPASGGVAITPLESYRRTLLGLPGYRPLQFTINQGDPFVGLTQWEVSLFAQDDWRAASRLTLSYGLRSEFQTHLANKLNFAPRAALAWRLSDAREGTLRVGAGFFYTRLDTGITIDAARFNNSRVTEIVIQRPSFFANVPTVFNPATTLTAIHTKSPDLTAPYTFISTASYEQHLFHNLSATVGYTFERGVHLLRTRNINAPLPGTLDVRPSPTQGAVLEYESNGLLKRHEFSVTLQGDLSSKLSFYGSYRLAFARSDTDGAATAPANSYDLSNEFARSGLDQRHQFYFEAFVALPWDVRLSPNVFAVSGAPFNITTGNDDNGDTLFTDRPAFANATDPGAIVTRFGIFNPHPQTGDPIIPRNFGRGAGELSVNLNISKTFAFGDSTESADNDADATGEPARAANSEEGERRGFFRRFGRNLFARRYNLTVSADVLNLLNHTNFGGYNSVITSPLFGRPNRANDARRINLGVTFSF